MVDISLGLCPLRRFLATLAEPAPGLQRETAITLTTLLTFIDP